MTRKPFHRASFGDLNISPYQTALVRECEICKCQYTIDAHEPWEWAGGVTSFANLECCEHWCLACTLGVGPTDFPESYPEEESAAELDPTDEAAVAEQARGNIAALQIGPRCEEWADDRTDEVYAALCRGDILKAYSFFTDQDIPLIIMPLTRAISDRSVHYPNGITYYPTGTANFDGLDHLDEVADPDDRAIRLSEYAGATIDNLSQHALLVFPAILDPQLIAKADHDVHLDLVRRLSEEVDKVCLNFVRYYSCKLEKPHAIPARAGQMQLDPAMSICLVYDPEKKVVPTLWGSCLPICFHRRYRHLASPAGVAKIPRRRGGRQDRVSRTHALRHHAGIQQRYHSICSSAVTAGVPRLSHRLQKYGGGQESHRPLRLLRPDCL